jgi:hypothetical protein
MKMDVRHHLAGGPAIGLRDIDAIRLEGFDLGLGDLLHDHDQFLERCRRCVCDGVNMLFGHHQRVALGHRSDVHEGQDIIVLINFHAGKRPGDDFAKYAIRIHDTPPCGIRNQRVVLYTLYGFIPQIAKVKNSASAFLMLPGRDGRAEIEAAGWISTPPLYVHTETDQPL